MLFFLLLLTSSVLCQTEADNKYTTSQFAQGVISGDFSYVISKLAPQVQAYFPGQGYIYNEAVAMAFATHAGGVMGNYVTGEYDPNFVVMADEKHGLSFVNRTLSSPRSGKSAWVATRAVLYFNELGQIYRIEEGTNNAQLSYVMDYLYDDVGQFCKNYVEVCGGERVFSKFLPDNFLTCYIALRNTPQTETEKDLIINGDNIMCRNFLLTPVILSKAGTPGLEMFTCSMLGKESPICT